MHLTENDKRRPVFLIGAKSIGQYGGYETFIDKLTEYHAQAENIRYYVATKKNGSGAMDETKLTGVSDVVQDENGDTVSFAYHNAVVFRLKVPEVGAASAILYDLMACRFFIRYCREKGIRNPVFYIMACRIGPFIRSIRNKVHALGGKLYVNPDGHEWKRSKWSKPVRKYWKYSEKKMVRNADLLVADSKGIERYLHEEYGKYDPKTTFISYGSETGPSSLSDSDPAFSEWLQKAETVPFGYDLVVGRFVPENNIETMVREYMKSASKRKLVLVTNENPKLFETLENKLGFSKDPRIVFAGPTYHPELLKKIRENAFLYLHGHSVGGTNPSLLEAMGSTRVNLLFDVSFNREVAEESALYWTAEEGNLSALIDRVDGMSEETLDALGENAKRRIKEAYSWEKIAAAYEDIFR